MICEAEARLISYDIETISAECKPKAVIMEQMLREVPVRTGKILDGMRDQLEDFARRVDVAVIATGD